MRQKIFELIFVIILGLTPLLWFHGNQIILGHDSGLTLSPISHFLDRLYPWTERFGFGNDQTYAMPGFFIHGLEAFISFIGFNLQEVQKITFVFWFLLPGLTMYFFSVRLAKKLNLKYFVLPVTVFYMFNHFLLQGWFVAERTKFSVYAALPLIMLFLFDWAEGKRKTFRTGFLISIVLFLLNGEASLPLFGGLILSSLVFAFFYFLEDVGKDRLGNLVKLVVLTIFFSFLLNLYWILPYGINVLQNYSGIVSQAGGLSGILTWVDYISSNSSFSNIFRLQGIPEWYLNNLHPYASFFLRNPLLIALSFLFPIAAFLPLYVTKDNKKRKKIIFFSFLALFSMIFIAGSHPPFGAIYVFLINFVPGFIAFRNPYYKFAPALWFSYAILIGFTIDYFAKKLEFSHKFKNQRYVFYFLTAVILVLYSFPFLNGSFFDYMKGVRSTRITVPQYVFDFGKWSTSKDRINTKVLALPSPNFENKADAYTWGYWSLSPITSLLTNAPIINESNYMSNTEISLVEKLYKMMRDNDPGWKNFARALGIKSFLLRRDFDWNLKNSLTNRPSDYLKALTGDGVEFSAKFGDWEVYDLKNVNMPEVKISKSLNYVVGDPIDLARLASLPEFNPDEIFYVSQTAAKNPEQLLKMRNKLFLVPSCVSCNLQHKFINLDLYTPLITRDSLLYFIVQFKDKITESKLSSDSEKLNYYIYKSLREILGLDKLVSEKKDAGIFKSQIIAYGKSLESLEKPLSGYLTEENIDNNFLLELSDVLRREKTVILKNANDISDKETSDLLNEEYKIMGKIKERIDSVLWRTADELNKRFIFSSNTSGDFDLFYKPSPQSSLSASLEIDNKSYDITPESKGAGWYNFGKFTLSKGVHTVNVKYIPDNLYKGPLSLEINSSGSCYKFNKIKGNKNDIYRISFQHRRLSGSRKFYTRVIPGDIEPNPLDPGSDVLGSTSVWDSYSTDYALRDDGSFYLTICDRPLVDNENFVSTIELRDVNIRKIGAPNLVFYNSTSRSSNLTSDYIKKSQAEYNLSNQDYGQKIIMLNESYNQNWMVNINGQSKFTANAHANGWLVNGSNFKIKYQLQDFVKLGFILSSISAFLSIIYLLFKK